MGDRAITWFRMYAEAVDDEKLRLLAFEDRWHFFALLCCKAQGVLDHGDPLMRRKVALKLGLAARELDEVSRRLAEVGLIDGETLEPNAWDKRQFRSDQDSTAAERARRYRESRRVTDASRVTDTLRHGRVTRPETETETEKEKEKKDKAPSPQARRAVLRPDDVPESVWTDFLAIRKAKRAPLTETALQGIRKQADRASMTLAEALRMCCERGWQGFRADWVCGKGGGDPDPWEGAL